MFPFLIRTLQHGYDQFLAHNFFIYFFFQFFFPSQFTPFKHHPVIPSIIPPIDLTYSSLPQILGSPNPGFKPIPF